MKYADTVVGVARLTVRNPFAVVLVSVGASVSVLPFLIGILVAGVLGAVVGLWTTSMLLGFVGVGGARISNVVLEREVSLGTSYFWEGIRSGPKMAAAVGVGTFLVAAVALLLVLNPATGIVGLIVAMLGVYALVTWFVFATFSLALWGSLERPGNVGQSFSDGGRLLLGAPLAVVWLVVQAVGWTLLSVPLIIAPVVLLPGFVQFVGTALVREAQPDDSEKE